MCVCITNHSTWDIGRGRRGCNVSSLSAKRQSRSSHQSCSIIPWWAKKERREGGPGGGGGTKGRRVVINGEAIWFLLGDALLRGSPAVNEFVWRMENDFSRNIRVVSRPSSRGRRREGGTRSSRIIYAVALRRANQRAPFFPSQTIFFFLAEGKASLLFFFFFQAERSPLFSLEFSLPSNFWNPLFPSSSQGNWNSRHKIFFHIEFEPRREWNL